MGKGLEIISGITTAAGATLTPLTMNGSDSRVVRNANKDSKTLLLQAWALCQAAGRFQIRSPSLHDDTNGMTFRTVSGDASPLMPMGCPTPLFPQDTLNLYGAGSATAGDIDTFVMLVYYEDLPGVDAHLIDYEELKQRIVELVTVENTISTGTAGGYSGAEAINAESDLLKANTDYALLGCVGNTDAAVVTYKGADTGNLRVGVPFDTSKPDITKDWFVKLSMNYGLPLIPVFNSANKGGVSLEACVDENGGDPVVTTILARLANK